LLGFSFFQGDIVWISAKNVFELTLQLVYIIIMLASKIELNLLIFDFISFLLFSSFVEIFSEILDDTIKVVSVLLPKLAELFWTGFDNF
jgi:hypothetical protein